jgi:K+ transporter
LLYAVNGSLLALDLLFFASTSTKLFEGDWFPLLITFIVAFLMLTWRKGTRTRPFLDQEQIVNFSAQAVGRRKAVGIWVPPPRFIFFQKPKKSSFVTVRSSPPVEAQRRQRS